MTLPINGRLIDKKILIGRLTINKKVSPTESLLFDPTIVGEGIDLPEDPILHFRHDAMQFRLIEEIKRMKKYPKQKTSV